MAVVDITIVPLGTGSTSLSKYVAECHSVLKDFPELKWQLNPGSTTLEGELDLIIKAVLKMHEIPFNKGALRVSTHIKIDDRRDKKGSMEQKVKSVQAILDN